MQPYNLPYNLFPDYSGCQIKDHYADDEKRCPYELMINILRHIPEVAEKLKPAFDKYDKNDAEFRFNSAREEMLRTLLQKDYEMIYPYFIAANYLSRLFHSTSLHIKRGHGIDCYLQPGEIKSDGLSILKNLKNLGVLLGEKDNEKVTIQQQEVVDALKNMIGYNEKEIDNPVVQYFKTMANLDLVDFEEQIIINGDKFSFSEDFRSALYLGRQGVYSKLTDDTLFTPQPIIERGFMKEGQEGNGARTWPAKVIDFCHKHLG